MLALARRATLPEVSASGGSRYDAMTTTFILFLRSVVCNSKTMRHADQQSGQSELNPRVEPIGRVHWTHPNKLTGVCG